MTELIGLPVDPTEEKNNFLMTTVSIKIEFKRYLSTRLIIVLKDLTVTELVGLPMDPPEGKDLLLTTVKIMI